MVFFALFLYVIKAFTKYFQRLQSICRPSKLWGPGNQQPEEKNGQEMKNLMTDRQTNGEEKA